MRFTISARGKPEPVPILAFLARSFADIPIAQIDSVFGFVEASPLYGGRVFVQPELSPPDVASLEYTGVGLETPADQPFCGAG